jgi:hypothetical protein
MSVAPRSRGIDAAIGVARRDLLEFVRDRRTLFITLLMPMVMYPVLALSSLLGLRTAISDIEARQQPRRLVVAVSGADAEPFAARVRDVVVAAAVDPPADWPAGVAVDVVGADDAANRLDAGRADVWLHVGPHTVASLDGDGTVQLDVRVSAVRPVEGRVRGHFLAASPGRASPPPRSCRWPSTSSTAARPRRSRPAASCPPRPVRCSCCSRCSRRPAPSIRPSTPSPGRRSAARSKRCSSPPAGHGTSCSASIWRCSR